MKPLNRLLFVLGIICCMSFPLVSQVNNTLYFMHGVPQSNRVNPAFQPRGNIYIGFPLMAPIKAGFSSSSLAWKDVIYQHPTDADSLITFMHPYGSKQQFLDQLKPVNVFVSDFGTSLISFGFRTDVGFFSMDVVSRWDGNIYYPGDLARFILQEEHEGETYEMDGIGTDLMAFDEISVGWSEEVVDNLTIGVRAKALFGVGDLSTTNSVLSVSTSQEIWNIKSDMKFNASLPFAEVVYDEDDMIEDVIIDDALENPDFSTISNYMFNTKNFGLGVDLGVDYWPMDQLQISVSLLDLGYIKWKDEVHKVDYETEYDFTGLELNPFDLAEDYTFEDYLDSTLGQMADSLVGFLQFTPGGAYSKRLNTKLFAGVSYYLMPNINLGILSRTDFLNGKVSEQVSASANFSTGRFLNLSLSYSYMNAYYKNIGAGLSINAGPLNLYLISDNVLNIVCWPEEARSVNLWFGLNFVFGYKEKLDHPLLQ